MRIAVVTCDGRPDAWDADQPLIDACAAAGMSAQRAVWSDAAVDWARFDAAIVRTTWDYQFHRAAFLGWIARASTATRLLNPPSVLRWGFDKRHLMALAAAGLPVIPTLYPAHGDSAHVLRWAAAHGWRALVLKPVLGAGGVDTVRVAADAAALDAAWHSVSVREDGYLAQPFLSSVLTAGELSVLTISGMFSHAVVKTPRSGEFRVQASHGGLFRAVAPPPEALALAQRALCVLPEPPLFARVDLVQDNSAWRIIECEVIEPDLYFGHAAASPAMLVRAIGARMAAG